MFLSSSWQVMRHRCERCCWGSGRVGIDRLSIGPSSVNQYDGCQMAQCITQIEAWPALAIGYPLEAFSSHMAGDGESDQTDQT